MEAAWQQRADSRDGIGGKMHWKGECVQDNSYMRTNSQIKFSLLFEIFNVDNPVFFSSTSDGSCCSNFSPFHAIRFKTSFDNLMSHSCVYVYF